MKPENWDTLSSEEKKEVALRLFARDRGSYIISQALVIAIEELNKVNPVEREFSNVEDMETLLELYPFFRIVVEMEKLSREDSRFLRFRKRLSKDRRGSRPEVLAEERKMAHSSTVKAVELDEKINRYSYVLSCGCILPADNKLELDYGVGDIYPCPNCTEEPEIIA
jgi:hypothetical protein